MVNLIFAFCDICVLLRCQILMIGIFYRKLALKVDEVASQKKVQRSTTTFGMSRLMG